MDTASKIVETLGRDALCTELGVGFKAVSKACTAGSFPSAWFVAMRDMGLEQGRVVPETMFRWKKAAKDELPE